MAKERKWKKTIADDGAVVSLVVATWFVFCLLVRGISGGGGGSCSEAKLCCPGRDSSCVVQKTPVEDVNEKPCYCDHACLKLGDCCADFKKACRVADCLVSVWQKWSACDANCGTGMMRRSRTIVKHPANGGRHCPSLLQRRACLGTSCPQNPSSALKEIAMLLPAATATTTTTTTFSNRTSLRKANVTASYRGPFDLENDVQAPTHTYCVQFKVVKAAKACKNEFSFSALGQGEKVCVQCDGEAIRPSLGYRCAGHGTTHRSTSWSALSAPHCHGKWVRLDACSSSNVDSENAVWSAMPATCLRLCAEGPRFVFV